MRIQEDGIYSVINMLHNNAWDILSILAIAQQLIIDEISTQGRTQRCRYLNVLVFKLFIINSM